MNRWLRRTAYGAALVPVGVAAAGAVLVGRYRTAAGWWLALRRWSLRTAMPTGQPRAGRIVAHTVVSLLLAALALLPLGVQVLFLFRGVLYGVVTDGPHTHDWGGPTTAGAWAAHFAISLPLALAALLMLAGLAGLHGRLTGWLVGERLAWWVLPVTVVGCLAGALFFTAWLRQV